jgi:proline iminopeptidase
VRYWELPTGSRIAYLAVPAAVPTEMPPMVFLHGGPAGGIVTAKIITEAISSFNQYGFDVYIYDQIGGGLSARLADIEEYTVSRHVADLESIRRQLGTETIILIGESWGGELATQYVAAYPERVDRLVLINPGALSNREWGDVDPCDLVGRASAENRERFNDLLSLRFLMSDLLLDINPAAAHDFLPDAEGDAFGEELMSLLLDGMVCDPDRIPDDTRIGISVWAYTMTDIDREKIEIADLAESLGSNDIPVLIFKGECDYCLWEVTNQYKELFPNTTLLYIEGAGHILYLDKPEIFHEATRAFLLDEPLPVQPYLASEPPLGVYYTLRSIAP